MVTCASGTEAGPMGATTRGPSLSQEITLGCWLLASAHTWSLAADPIEDQPMQVPHKPMIEGLGTTTGS